jgi:hypothetical protein
LTSSHRARAGSGGALREGPGRLPGAVFALLVAACFAAFFVTQRLKHTPTLIQRFELTPRFSPASSGNLQLEAISFKLSHAERVTVTIVDSAGNDVATLVREQPLERYKQFSLRWNGRRGVAHGFTFIRTASGRAVTVPSTRGSLAPAGDYRVRVSLRTQHRTLLSPRTFTLVRP